jgi:hypothetical protein
MGKFKDQGKPAAALAEECAEVISACSEIIKIVNKKDRFDNTHPLEDGDNWNEIPPGKDISRWNELCEEMEDVIYQWNRLVMQRYYNEHPGEQFPHELWAVMAHMNRNVPTAEDSWDGDETDKINY